MVLNEVPEIFDGNYMTKFDYRVPRRESVRYNYYSYSLAVAIVFCSLWLLCRLKKRWFTNAKCSLCKRIAEMWKRYKKVENLAQAVDGKKPTVRSIKAEIDRPKNSDSSNEQLNTTSFFDISNFDQMTERSLMIEKVYLRKHLLTSETKLNASMRETMEIRKMLLLVMGNEMPIGESPPRRLKIDASAQYSNVKGRDGNGSSTRSCLEDDARSSEATRHLHIQDHQPEGRNDRETAETHRGDSRAERKVAAGKRANYSRSG
ncbi:hypothetical protein TSAR_002482 [Trichomalopsis sarcophagae]|uniref:Uncharacterized protein n=1 Tax=Trichomalopsis sarcophagae TaxID=543379 RepID=A0A232FAI5_9HYME|nr:hypothetical protein TSAR_002482 [Trichomalopsis sarcophagae]